MWSDQLRRHAGDAQATLHAFTEWLWSGNGFSKERYTKLGLQRPTPPSSMLEQAAQKRRGAGRDVDASIVAATGQGLECLRLHEGMATPHAPGAITNPNAPQYKGPPAHKFNSSMGNPTRTFVA